MEGSVTYTQVDELRLGSRGTSAYTSERLDSTLRHGGGVALSVHSLGLGRSNLLAELFLVVERSGREGLRPRGGPTLFTGDKLLIALHHHNGILVLELVAAVGARDDELLHDF